jgi:hypothetical protein
MFPTKQLVRYALAAFLVCQLVMPALTRAADGGDKFAKVIESMPQSKLTLAQGIEQATAKAPEAAISAKFEIHDGHLALSVYTAEKGLNGDAEHNVLKELIGSPAGAKWTPDVEVFKDVPHVSRSAQQLALMSLTKLSLVDVINKAQQDGRGAVLSIAPAIRDGKPVFALVMLEGGKATEVQYDLITGLKLGGR